MKNEYTIGAGEFKTKCLKIMDQVQSEHVRYTITKHGKPVAQLVPSEPKKKPRSPFGCMKGSVIIHGNIMDPIDEIWEAEQ